jgi:hypothetical protein
LDEHLSERDLVRLYSSSQVLVAPYRGEGFALPVLEAMACGAHVIVTAGGATDDFVDGTCGTRIASDKRYSTAELGDGTRCIDRMWFLEADTEELSRAMRWAYENPERSWELGHAASLRARREWTWERAADLAIVRLNEIAERPVRREFLGNIERQASTAGKSETAPPESAVFSPEVTNLRALELDLMRQELTQTTQDSLRHLSLLRPLSPETLAVLHLAEKVLSIKGAFAARGLEQTTKGELLRTIRDALSRNPEQ